MGILRKVVGPFDTSEFLERDFVEVRRETAGSSFVCFACGQLFPKTLSAIGMGSALSSGPCRSGC
jgi:hypothetical protein